MKKNKIWVLLLVLTFTLASCAMARNTVADSGTAEFQSMPPLAAAPYAEKGFREEGAQDSAAFESGNGVESERIVIKNANLSIVVVDPLQSMQTISQMAAGMGGFTVFSNSYKTTTGRGMEVPVANITVRVPAEKLDEALATIKGLVKDEKKDILSEDVSGQDVTKEVTDLESRLRNLQAAEVQLLEIMENADTTEDVIAIFRELTSIRTEIEVIQGQIKYYRESASLSAINVNLQAEEALEPITIAGWEPGKEVQKALQALVDGGQSLVNGLIWLTIFLLPLLAVILLPIYLIIRFFQRRRKKKVVEPTE